MEPDPLALEAGLNVFAYAGNNPVMNVDPSGLSSSPINIQMPNLSLALDRPISLPNLPSLPNLTDTLDLLHKSKNDQFIDRFLNLKIDHFHL